MPSLNLSKEDVYKELADLREDVVSSVDRRIAEIKADVDLVNNVRSKPIPFHADGVISTVQDLRLEEHNWRSINGVRFDLNGQGSYFCPIPQVKLDPGRYRVFISVHKVQE